MILGIPDSQNLDILDFEILEDDMKAIAKLDENRRVGWGGPLLERGGEMRPRDEPLESGGGHPNYPFVMTTDGMNDASVF